MKSFLFYTIYLLSLNSAAIGSNFFTSIEQIGSEFAPFLRNKTVAIGIIKERNTGKRLNLSNAIVDGLSNALQNNGIEVVISELDLSEEDVDVFDFGIFEAKVIIIGSFQKWGNYYVVRCRAIDTYSGKTIISKSTNINGYEIPPDMLVPIKIIKLISGVGTASISYQCREDENPCPPKTELKRRAIRVAKLSAIREISEKTGVNVNTISSVINGQIAADLVETRTHKRLNNLIFQDPIIKNDELIIELLIEID